MNRPDSGSWQRSSPFAIVFFVGSTFKTIARSVFQMGLAFAALVFVLRDNPASATWFLLIGAVAVLLILATAVLQWRYLRFKVEDDRLLIRQGFLKKTALDIPFDRVQGINVTRSPIDRMLGLVTVSLDTSGSFKAEGKLPSVKTELADRLRGRVGALRRTPEDDASGAGAGPPGSAGGKPAADAQPAHAASRGQILLKLGTADMVRIGLASRRFILVAALVGVATDFFQPGDYVDTVSDAIGARVGNAANALAGMDAIVQSIVVGGLVLSFLAVAVVLVIAAAFLSNHDFTLWHDGNSLRSRAGLLTQREVAVETAKIQQLTLSQNIVLRWFGRYRLRALPATILASPGGQDPGVVDVADVLDVPLLDDRVAEELRSRVFLPEARGVTLLPRSEKFNPVSPYYIRALTLRISTVSALIGAAIVFPSAGPAAAARASLAVLIWWLVSILPAALIAWQLWRRKGYLHDDDGLATRSGFIGAKVDACLLRKAQSATVTQSPLQRRKGLATLSVNLACGRVSVPYIDQGVASRLRDYILYKVESSRLRWH